MMFTEEEIIKRREHDYEMAKLAKEAEGGAEYLLHALGIGRDRERDLQDSGHLFALLIHEIDNVINDEDREADDALDDIQWLVKRAKDLMPPNFPTQGDMKLLNL